MVMVQENGHFRAISSIAVDNWGNVYVADGNNQIQKFDSNGHFITKWGTKGSVNEQFYSISSIGVDSSGNVYAADVGKSDNFIHVYSPNR